MVRDGGHRGQLNWMAQPQPDWRADDCGQFAPAHLPALRLTIRHRTRPG